MSNGHRQGCAFGTGFYRVVLSDGGVRYCQTTDEVEFLHRLLPDYAVKRVQRDGFCLDQDDLASPHVIDGERFLNMPQAQAMREVGIDSDEEYARAYQAIEEAVLARDRKAADGGDYASVVIKRRGVTVHDIS